MSFMTMDAALSFRGLLFHKIMFEKLRTSARICLFTHQQLSCQRLLQKETYLPKQSSRDTTQLNVFNKIEQISIMEEMWKNLR